MPQTTPQALLISHAAPPEGTAADALGSLTLLKRLLSQASERSTERLTLDATCRSMPHEVMHARRLGLPADDGRIPWAALRAQQLGHDAALPWAFVSPCHWAPGADHIRMHDTATLALRAGDAQQLREAMAPWFEPEGIRLLVDPDQPARWLACGEPLRGLVTASLDRVSGRTLDMWMPEGPGARLVRRLQSEMQMLLYQHPLHDARRAQGLQPVNSFWMHGSGELPAGTLPRDAGLQVVDTLRSPSLAQDPGPWLAAWRDIEAMHLSPMLSAFAQRHASPSPQATQFILAGERSARVFELRAPGALQRVTAWLRSGPSAASLHAMLSSL